MMWSNIGKRVFGNTIEKNIRGRVLGALLTIRYESLKVANTNPAQTLRNELGHKNPLNPNIPHLPLRLGGHYAL